jgi:hypothetical protein
MEETMIQTLIKVLSAAAFASFAFVPSAAAQLTYPKPYDLCGDLKLEKALAGGNSPFQTTSKAFVLIPDAVIELKMPGDKPRCLKVRITGTVQCNTSPAKTCMIKPHITTSSYNLALFAHDSNAGAVLANGSPGPTPFTVEWIAYAGTTMCCFPTAPFIVRMQVNAPAGGSVAIKSWVMTVQISDTLPAWPPS